MSSERQNSTTLRAQMEDNVLNPVADEERQGGWSLLSNTAGVGTTLAMLLIGGSASYIVGVKWAIAMSVVSAVFGSVVGSLTGRVSQSTGMSSTVTTRFHGLGATGSALASFVFAWMILSFLALENVLLYNGTLFMLGWAPTVANTIGIYGALTVLWILLALFGVKLVQKTSLILTLIAGALMVVVGFLAFSRSDLGVGQVFAVQPEHVGPAEIMGVLATMVGMAGALALTGADFARYARTSRDVRIMAVGGNVIVNFGVVSLGALLYQAGDTVVARFLEDPANAGVAAAQAGAGTAEKVRFLAETNAGAYFILLAGVVGFLVMYAAQVKAQVINVYAGSLSLTNLVDALLGRKVSRILMVLLGNAIALVAVWGGILGFLAQFLGALGIATFSLAALVITDFYVLRRQQAAPTDRVERMNWAGLIAVAVGFGTSYLLLVTGVFVLGFVITLVLTPLVYVVLRRTVLPEGRGTTFVAGTAALREVEVLDEVSAV
ncbi:cytosine permease [Georgenia sp. EYE_87]|uniref:purine-cytosine permease family protein n=1 Tax=Georgenia sp. EYE_87 TaxID=2853448 RepID=UPI002004B2B1|nr:cytosine permease [Georgenia sp. EYE_87]MCK6210771.1 cytosine permease [Georgenia sp. EYE_87]